MSERLRVSVRRNGLTVPLIPGATGAETNAPSSKLLCEKHRFQQLDLPAHEHEHFCPHLQIFGSPTLEWWSDGRCGRERPEPGSLILIPGGTQDCLSWQGLSERYVVSLDADYFKSVVRDSGLREDPHFTTRWHFRDSLLEHLLREIGRESTAGWLLGELYSDVLSLRLTLALLQRHAVRPIKIASAKAGLSPRLLRIALEFITDNLQKPLRLADIASEAELSPFHFLRLFRQATKTTPYQYLLEQRTVRAKDLLQKTALPLEEIGHSVGFGSLAQFSHSFTSRAGISPRHWRKQTTSR